MDLVTQIALGAVVGQFGFQRTLGRKAIGYGALAGLIPDLDIVVKLSSNPYAEMLYHRGLTHSLFFAVIAGIFLGYGLWRGHARTHPLRIWVYLMIAGLMTHPLLDLFTVYGTQLLSPFSDHRFALSAIPVIDPVYTVPLLISGAVGILWKERITLSHVYSGLTLFFTTAYLFIGLAINDIVTAHTLDNFNAHNIYPYKLNVYTTMLQLPLRRVVAHFKDEVRVSFRSAHNLDDPFWSFPFGWQSMKKAPEHLFTEFKQTEDYRIFKWFTSGDFFVSAEKRADGTYDIMARDLRYGFDDETLFGLWGLKTVVNENGHIVEPIRKAGLNRLKLMDRLKKFLM
ncbi:MAG: metal-dependent hydrolase [Alphaproteobacteria bacterium]|nr:metal-dependent hydrolase [Alphaproteobacteria bacterium]